MDHRHCTDGFSTKLSASPQKSSIPFGPENISSGHLHGNLWRSTRRLTPGGARAGEAVRPAETEFSARREKPTGGAPPRREGGDGDERGGGSGGRAAHRPAGDVGPRLAARAGVGGWH